MTTAEIRDLKPVPAPTSVGQATVVEQARAVAEVQAAVVVAQQVPRHTDRAITDMRDSCSRFGLASRAFYTVPNRGHGPSVHLARELARIWGNIQYGVHELRRDDEAGESEVQAFAWDLQTNTRSTRTFVVPHARMKGKERVALTDLGDIYLSNQNVGARAVRECIFTVLPMWFTEEAQDMCRATLEHGDGQPLAERIANMVAAFDALGVTVAQLERKVGRKRSTWTGGTVATLTISYTSITRDGISPDEEFGSAPVTAEEITAQIGASTPSPTPSSTDGDDRERITDAQLKKLHACLGDLGITAREDRLAWLSKEMGKPITSSSELTKVDARTVIDVLEHLTSGVPDPS